jgi:uncharacterized protein
MRKVSIIFIVVSLASSVFIVAKTRAQDYKSSICFGVQCLTVEIADTYKSRRQGLMFRENLPSGSGMLFVFEEEGTYGFWMKNTYMPLDIIWMNKEKEVVFIKRSAQPCMENSCSPIYPDEPALYALEVNAAEPGALGLRVKDKAVFNIK